MLGINFIFNERSAYSAFFNYINEARESEGRVEDNVILLAVSTPNYRGTALLSAHSEHSQHRLSARAIHYFLLP